MDTTKAEKNWQALQAFYNFKAKLLPEFHQRNIRTINSLEAMLKREYEASMQENEPIDTYMEVRREARKSGKHIMYQ